MQKTDVHEHVAKPLPTISDFNRPFWDATRRHEFRVQHCNACGKFWAPAGPVCPHCFADDYEWRQVSGSGRIAAWVVFHKLYHLGFAEDVPYNVAFVELAEGPRVISNIVNVRNEDLKIGMPVTVTFEKINDDITIPKFRPALG